MGTRGTFGFFYKGKYYVCYNHYDSYPSCLGVHLILEILQANFDEWIALLEKIIIVDRETEPTEEEIKKLEKYTNLNVSNQSTKDFYCLLRFTQGSFYHVLQSGYLINYVDEEGLPIHEEYTYVLNFDEGTLELFGDFNEDEENNNEDGEWIKIRLDHDELLDIAKKWCEGPLPEKYDPEEHLNQIKEIERKQQELLAKVLNMK